MIFPWHLRLLGRIQVPIFFYSLLLLVSLQALSFPVFAEVTSKQGVKATRFEFAVTGDTPYSVWEEDRFRDMVKAMNKENLAFVVHVGDFKNGGALCDDATFQDRKLMFQASRRPFIYVPGDNDWTDCHRISNGGFDPRERLAKLRELFFQGDFSLGQATLKLERQSADPRYAQFRENVRWIHGGVLFIGLNIPGSNNNFGRTKEMDAEYRERNAANLAWMKQAFELARQEGLKGIVLSIQANPYFELPPTHKDRSGFNEFLAALESETSSFGKPVLLVHGDTHHFRIDKPRFAPGREQLPNFTRLETYGSPYVNWVRVKVDPADPKLFSFERGMSDEFN